MTEEFNLQEGRRKEEEQWERYLIGVRKELRDKEFEFEKGQEGIMT